MSHNKNTYNKRELPRVDHSEHGHNPSCGDDITLNMTFDGEIISAMSYKGIGCAISQASASMMIDLMTGKTKGEALALAETFIGMIKATVTEEEAEDLLGESSILANIKHMPARVKCAVLAWHTLQEAIGHEAAGGREATNGQ